jgi:5'(3')-deoxyribonucleotidase
MKDFTIGIDVDGVLRDNLQIMVDLYNESFKKNKEVSDIKDFRTEITFPDIEPITGKTASEWFFQDHSKEIFLKAKPFYNVAEDIKRLRELANVVIITYQKSLVNRMHTLCWLEINGIEYDGLIFMKDKTKFICDYLIDDNDWNFLGSNAKHGILIDAPYNEG